MEKFCAEFRDIQVISNQLANALEDFNDWVGKHRKNLEIANRDWRKLTRDE